MKKYTKSEITALAKKAIAEIRNHVPGFKLAAIERIKVENCFFLVEYYESLFIYLKDYDYPITFTIVDDDVLPNYFDWDLID